MKNLVSYGLISLGTITYLLNPTTVHAQGASLSIYPPVIEIQTTAPSSPIVPVVIHNNATEDVNINIQLVPFRTNNITGDVRLLPLEANKGLNPVIMEKVQFLLDGKRTDSFVLNALETKELQLNINLLQGDPPGDYYYSIVFVTQNNTQPDSSVSQLPVGISTNLLLSIGPKSKAMGGISEFTTSTFKTQGPVAFKLKLHNASKHLINPTGNIEVTNLWGQKVANIKILPQYILAGADRYLMDEKTALESSSEPIVIWPEKMLLGWYKATATIQLEENGNTLTSSSYFFAFPIFLFFAVVIVIFIAVSIYLRVKRKI